MLAGDVGTPRDVEISTTPVSADGESPARVGMAASVRVEIAAATIARTEPSDPSNPAGRQHDPGMVRYSITFGRSRWGTLAPPDWRPVGPPGARLLVARRETRWAPARWSLVGSFAVHTCMAVVLVLIARRIPPPVQPVAETITVVFTPAPAAELLDVPSVPVVAAEPPRIQPPPEPQPPTADPLPSPPITIPEPGPPPVDLETPPPSIRRHRRLRHRSRSPSRNHLQRTKDPATLVDPPPRRRPRNEAHHAPTDPKTRAVATPQQCTALSSRTGAGANASRGTPRSDTGELAAPGGNQPGWQNAWAPGCRRTRPTRTRPGDGETRGATVRFTVNREGRVVDFSSFPGLALQS